VIRERRNSVSTVEHYSTVLFMEYCSKLIFTVYDIYCSPGDVAINL
jgi:hypothetical protein